LLNTTNDEIGLTKFLPYGRHSVDDGDIEAVVEVLRGDWLTTGPTVGAFEAALADVTGAKHAVVCSSGTAALHMAMLARGIGQGDAVIVPSVTFLATANAARYVGAEVVFADVDPDTGLMTAEACFDALQRADDHTVRCVAPVHLAGQCVDMKEIAGIAKTHGLSVVEDASHAIGTTCGEGDAETVGDCHNSDMTVFSFHPVKTVAMGEGGAVTTNDDGLADGLAAARNHGMTRDDARFENHDMAFADDGTVNPWYYEMAEPGFNYRATDLHCALGLSQLARLDAQVAKRQELADYYDAALAKAAPIVRPLARVAKCRPAWHLYAVLIDFASVDIDRATLMRQLNADGIGSQVHYIPVHHQPYYRARYGSLDLPGVDTYYGRTLSLPLYPALTKADVDRVVASLFLHLGIA
jgi:UDP-4-amino-4,6-dideoxy-N-acetyl-beta-L-altrosamine transaminase